MKIELTEEQEKLLEKVMNGGQFKSREEAVLEALTQLQLRFQAAGKAEEARFDDQSRAVRDMLAFVETNYVKLNGISVEDLINEGRKL